MKMTIENLEQQLLAQNTHLRPWQRHAIKAFLDEMHKEINPETEPIGKTFVGNVLRDFLNGDTPRVSKPRRLFMK